jgi:hypothetical protein
MTVSNIYIVRRAHAILGITLHQMVAIVRELQSQIGPSKETHVTSQQLRGRQGNQRLDAHDAIALPVAKVESQTNLAKEKAVKARDEPRALEQQLELLRWRLRLIKRSPEWQRK